MKVTWL